MRPATRLVPVWGVRAAFCRVDESPSAGISGLDSSGRCRVRTGRGARTLGWPLGAVGERCGGRRVVTRPVAAEEL